MVYIVLLICYFWIGTIFYIFLWNSLQLFIWIIDRAAINWFEWMQIIYFLIATLLIFYIFIWIAFPNSKAIVISTTMLNTTAMVVMQWWRRFAGMWWKPPSFRTRFFSGMWWLLTGAIFLSPLLIYDEISIYACKPITDYIDFLIFVRGYVWKWIKNM